MNTAINLIEVEGRLVAGSREVAKNFNKQHYNLIRDIENLIKKNPSVFEGFNYFIETSFEHRGNEYKEFLLTRDGLSLLVMGFNGTKALDWKIKYIDAFNKLEKLAIDNEPLKIDGSNNELLLQANETIKELQESLIINYEEANKIKKLAGQKVESILKSMNVTRPKLYGKLWQEYRKKFDITSYHNTTKKDLPKAERFISRWSYREDDKDGL